MIACLAIRLLLFLGLYGGGIACAVAGHPLVGLGIHVVVVGYLLAGTLNPSSRLFGPVQTHCGNGLWLTLDDGPDPVDTPAILDLLDRHQAKATFFVIGEKAAAHPELVREIHRRGHQVGNHSWSHPQASFWCLGPIRTYRQITRCQQTITEIIGEAPTVFRAPVGHSNIFVHPVLKRFGLRLVGWSSRGFDGVDSSVSGVTGRIRKTLGPGSIVLAHEGTPIAAAVVEDILAAAVEQGLACEVPG